MKPETLFLERCKRMAVLSVSTNEADLLDLGGYLRQMLCDQHCLIDVVKPDGLKLTFRVPEANSEFSPALRRGSLFEYNSMYVGRGERSGVLDLSKDEFLKREILVSMMEGVTVKELIRHASNVAGGVHYDPKPRPEYERVSRLLGGEAGGGLSWEVYMLREIAFTTLAAIEQLRFIVRSKEGVLD